uniref:Uncharacterized protein n=1 Tax=Oryza meridionalis TaxID=40149 RepID=A0A0E0F123_9ORYZ
MATERLLNYMPPAIMLVLAPDPPYLRVRVFARDAAKACYMAVTSGNETKDILTSLEERAQNMELILAKELFPSSLLRKKEQATG